MAISRTFWQQIQNSIWLVFGAGCLFFALAFWAISDQKEQLEIIKEPETEVEIQIQPEKVAATTNLGALQDEVRPLELTPRIVASGSHEATFRGTKFVVANKNSSTIELFRVTDENVVKDFIRRQPDQSNLYYIRLSGDNLKEQYAVLYGIYRNSDIAQVEQQKITIKLPDSIKPQINSFTKYIPYVNDLGSEEQGITGKVREVILKPVPNQNFVNSSVSNDLSGRRSNKFVSTEPGTTTIITRRDAKKSTEGTQDSQRNP